MGKEIINLLGMRFGHLLVIEQTSLRLYRSVVWKCICDCGNTKLISNQQLKSGKYTTCGICKIKDLNGKIFGRLFVIKLDGIRSANGVRKWICRCDCGNIKSIRQDALLSGTTKSCGCIQVEYASIKTVSNYSVIFNSIYCSYKKYAQKRNLLFELDTNQFMNLVTKNCYYCNKEPSNIKFNKKRTDYFKYNGIDRLDNSLGYDIRNCVPCCKWCNTAKSTMSEYDFLNMIERIYNNKRRIL